MARLRFPLAPRREGEALSLLPLHPPMPTYCRPPAWQLAVLLVLAAAGGIALLSMTPKGLGVSTDSVAYLGAARNQAAGLGLGRLTGDGGVKPMTHFPPLYPLILAGFQLLGLPALSGARLVSVVAFVGSGFLVGFLILRCSRSFLAALAGTALFVASPHMLEVHTWAMTEGLYLFLGLLAMALLVGYGESQRRALLLAASLAIAAAYLTRYVGISLLAAAAIYVALQPGPIRRRSIDLAALLAIGLLPMAGWMARNLRLTGSATNRRLQFHLPSADSVRDGFAVIWEWLVPYPFPAWGIAGILLLAGLSILFVLWITHPWRSHQLPRKSLGFFRSDPRSPMLLYLLAYLVVLAGSLLLVDASTPIDQRLAALLLSLVIVLVASTLPGLWCALAGKRVILRVLVVVGVALFLVSSLSRSRWLAREIQFDAGGLAAAVWLESGLAETLDALPPDTLLFTDNPEAVYFLSGRGAFGLPSRFDNVTMRDRPDYAPSLAELRRRLRNKDGAVVVFTPAEGGLERSIVEDVTRGLLLLYAGGEAEVYVTPGLMP
jgi:hypothetical protein